MEDWLDQRLAEDNYLPDDGFTQRVTSRLAESREQSVQRLRVRVLAPVGAIALALFVFQLIWTRGLAASSTVSAPMLNQFGATLLTSSQDFLGQLSQWVAQPMGWLACASAGTLVALGSFPLLRRWL